MFQNYVGFKRWRKNSTPARTVGSSNTSERPCDEDVVSLHDNDVDDQLHFEYDKEEGGE